MKKILALLLLSSTSFADNLVIEDFENNRAKLEGVNLIGLKRALRPSGSSDLPR